MMRRAFRFLLLSFLIHPIWSRGDITNEAISRATSAVKAATPRAQADPARPIFHVTAPAQWINDPNGPVFYNGFYHLFYQLHPFSDGDGPKYWGHVRSADLANWEHLPIALAPSLELGEAGVWSGCCVTNGRGEPMIFYTSVGRGRSPLEHAEQWAATSDDDLIHWRKLPDNPILSESLHGDRKIYDWRDPFIFHDSGKTFMVLGGSLNRSAGGQAVVNIYEAENDGLTEWKYRGVLFQHPDPDVRTVECPSFFRLGDHWVLLVSPYGRVQYFMGDFDGAICRFHSKTRGLLDFGPDFYAPNTMQVADGRRLVWGWVKGFPGGHGWNGCLSLPRQLSVSPDERLQQNPAPQLSQLRGKSVERRDVVLENGNQTLQLPEANTLEIRAEIEMQSAQLVELRLQSASHAQPIVVSYHGSELKVLDVTAPLRLEGAAPELKLRIFIDRSVLEVFANEIVCVTKTIPPLDTAIQLELRAEGGAAHVKQLDVWPIHSIW